MAPAMARGLIKFVSDLVCKAKRTYRDCSIMVSGDFNQWPINERLLKITRTCWRLITGQQEGTGLLTGRSLILEGR